MALRDVDSESDSAHPVTPMGEIRRHKGMLFDEFTRKYPDWEWSERRRRNRLMFDEAGAPGCRCSTRTTACPTATTSPVSRLRPKSCSWDRTQSA